MGIIWVYWIIMITEAVTAGPHVRSEWGTMAELLRLTYILPCSCTRTISPFTCCVCYFHVGDVFYRNRRWDWSEALAMMSIWPPTDTQHASRRNKRAALLQIPGRCTTAASPENKNDEQDVLPNVAHTGYVAWRLGFKYADQVQNNWTWNEPALFLLIVRLKKMARLSNFFQIKSWQKNIWDVIIVNRPPSRLVFLSLHLGFEETGQENCRLWGCNSDMTVYHFPVKLKHILPHRPRSPTQIVKSTCWENFTLLCACL